MREKIEQVIEELTRLEEQAASMAILAIEDHDVGRMAGRKHAYSMAINMLKAVIEDE